MGYTPEMLDEITATWDALQNESSGINLFDTAEIYSGGESEKIIGSLLKKTAAEGKALPVIATKFAPLPERLEFSSSLINALKDSMGRLDVNIIDWYMIHAPFEFLGLVKTVGVSNYSPDDVVRMHATLAKHGIQLASNQVEFSLLRRLPETSGLTAKCHELGFRDYPMEELAPLLAIIEKIPKVHNVPMAAVALNYTICKGAILLGGARNPEQARQNAKALDWRLLDREIAELESLSKIGGCQYFQRR